MTEEGFQAFQQWLPVARWLDGLEPAIPYACINPRRLRDFAKAPPAASSRNRGVRRRSS